MTSTRSTSPSTYVAGERLADLAGVRERRTVGETGPGTASAPPRKVGHRRRGGPPRRDLSIALGLQLVAAGCPSRMMLALKGHQPDPVTGDQEQGDADGLPLLGGSAPG